MKKERISWGQFGDIVENLIKKIEKTKFKFDGIYGIPRGGLPLAVILSHRLNLPLLLYPTKKSLVCDDISDTGKTLKSFKNRAIATLYYTKWTEVIPTFTVKEKKDVNSWIIFPWESKEEGQ